jgi:serine phosphatase RsbU (regulator of sigma subunit)
MGEIERQLKTIGDLQRRLLPRTVPQPAGWHVDVHYEIGRWPGGDYYDFLPYADGRLFVLIADGNDDGAPAVALVAEARVVLHACPISSGREQLPFCPLHETVVQPPHLVLGHLNRVLVDNSLEEQYLSMFCGVLDPLDGTFHYANAGHPAPRWWRAAQHSVEPLRDVAGLPLGMDAHAHYHQKRMEIEPGDLLVLYTDGVTASQNDRGQMFGSERLDEAIRAAADRGAAAVKTSIIARLEDFLKEGALQDDVTLVVVERARE